VWSCEHVLPAAASAEVVWAAYGDPLSWPTWGLPGSTVAFAGDFTVGARGTLTPAEGKPTRFTLIAVAPPAVCTDRTRLGATRIEISHSISPAAQGVVLTHRVTMRGPFSRLLGSFLGPRISRQQSAALRRLVDLLESPPRDSSAQ